MEELSATEARTYTTKKTVASAGNPIATVATTPVPTVPTTNFFFMPCMSAIEPSMGMSRAITKEAIVSA